MSAVTNEFLLEKLNEKQEMAIELALTGMSDGEIATIVKWVDSGAPRGNLAFVVGPDGALEPRTIVLGVRSGSRVQVARGLEAGERIVASANFLVDAESRLQTGTGTAGMPGMPEHKP